MRILNDVQASDHETLVFGMTVINKTLHGVPDQVNLLNEYFCLKKNKFSKKGYIF